MTVSAGNFLWRFDETRSGKRQIIFRPPEESTHISGQVVDSGRWFIVNIRLSWKGITVYTKRFEVAAFGIGVNGVDIGGGIIVNSDFSVKPYLE